MSFTQNIILIIHEMKSELASSGNVGKLFRSTIFGLCEDVLLCMSYVHILQDHIPSIGHIFLKIADHFNSMDVKNCK